MKRKLLFLIALVLIFALLAMPVGAAKPPADPPRTQDTVSTSVTDADHWVADLVAGKTLDVGDIYINATSVENEYEVRYEVVEDGWYLTEVHFEAISENDEYYIENKGTLIPGKFTEKAVFDIGEMQTEYSFLYTAGAAVTDFAAHAVVSMTECEIDETVPLCIALAYEQGMTYSGGTVLAAHTFPGSVGTYEVGRSWTNFISLGFQSEVLNEDTAWIIVEFDMPIQNKDGLDVLVVEDTYGPYPVETALVEASQDGVNWVTLGYTNPRINDADNQVESKFDLGSLEWAKFIRVSDKSIKTDFATAPGEPNGFDLNAVISLQNNTTCWVVSESAWGAGVDAGTNNWAMIIPESEAARYYIWEEVGTTSVPATSNSGIDSGIVIENGELYRIDVSGVCNAGATIDFDAKFSITNEVNGDDWTDIVTKYEIYGPSLLDLFVNGVNVDWGDYNPSHEYSYEMPGDESSLIFRVYDSYPSNNTFDFSITIYQWVVVW